jgi:hypothetical protein
VSGWEGKGGAGQKGSKSSLGGHAKRRSEEEEAFALLPSPSPFSAHPIRLPFPFASIPPISNSPSFLFVPSAFAQSFPCGFLHFFCNTV